MGNIVILLSNPIIQTLFIIGTPYFLMRAVGRPLIEWLKGLKGMKWSPREDTPESHLKKAGVPSMGGIGIIGAALFGFISVYVFFYIFSILFARFPTPPNFFKRQILPLVVLPLIVLLHALLGFADDWSKARGHGGLLARQKLLGQIILAVGFLGLVIGVDYFGQRPDGFIIQSGESWWVWPSVIIFCALVVIGTSNAVNLTDGIDGLAAGLGVQVGLAFIPLLFSGWSTFNSSAVALWMSLGGACLGFLAFNKYPAKVFMGDTGSLALGAALGAGAILTRTVFLLPFIGFIFFVEMFSVIFQVLYFKWTKKRTGEGKRIFRRAPLHHHFELGGWSEWRVVGTFWAVNLVTSILGLVLWKMGILPRFP